MAVLSFSIVKVLQHPVAVMQGWVERPQQLGQHGARAGAWLEAPCRAGVGQGGGEHGVWLALLFHTDDAEVICETVTEKNAEY